MNNSKSNMHWSETISNSPEAINNLDECRKNVSWIIWNVETELFNNTKGLNLSNTLIQLRKSGIQEISANVWQNLVSKCSNFSELIQLNSLYSIPKSKNIFFATIFLILKDWELDDCLKEKYLELILKELFLLIREEFKKKKWWNLSKIYKQKEWRDLILRFEKILKNPNIPETQKKLILQLIQDLEQL